MGLLAGLGFELAGVQTFWGLRLGPRPAAAGGITWALEFPEEDFNQD